jgi:hypothetical protein
MHEGKHGILDGVDDMDDIFGTKDEHETEAGHDHAPGHTHDHAQDEKGKQDQKKDSKTPHSSGCGCD